MTSAKDPSPALISLSEVARKLNIPYPKARRLVGDGVLVPDYAGPQVTLFDPARLPSLARQIQL